MNTRSRWTFALVSGAAAVTCFVLFGILNGAIQYVFLALGVAFAGSGALSPTIGRGRVGKGKLLTADVFAVVLLETGDTPIQVIKTMREVAGLDFDSARRCAATTPSMVVRGVGLDSATTVSEALIGSGARARVEQA